MTIDEQYVRDYYDKHRIKDNEEYIPKVLEVMRKYSDNHWWESNNPYVLVKHQLNEPTLIIKSLGYLEDLVSIVLNRPFDRYEFVITPSVKEEIAYAIERYESGNPITDEEVRLDEEEGLKAFMSFMKEHDITNYLVVDEDDEIMTEEEIEYIIEESEKKKN